VPKFPTNKNLDLIIKIFKKKAKKKAKKNFFLKFKKKWEPSTKLRVLV